MIVVTCDRCGHSHYVGAYGNAKYLVVTVEFDGLKSELCGDCRGKARGLLNDFVRDGRPA